MIFKNNAMQHDLPKMREGQRPFGTYPKIHTFWWRHPSLHIACRINYPNVIFETRIFILGLSHFGKHELKVLISS